MRIVVDAIKRTANKVFEAPFDKTLETGNDLNLSSFDAFLSVFKRKILLRILLQHRYLQDVITIADRKILWVHSTTENIGDSLMKLSSIAYLHKKGYEVDLCLPPYIVDLYQNNAYCNSVFSLDQIDTISHLYDLIIIDSLGSKSLRLKNKYFKHSAFVTLYGYFNYYRPDYNATLFSFYRMQYFLRTNEPIEDIARPFIGKPVNTNIDIKSKTIAFVIGGTGIGYKDWDKVIDILDAEIDEKKPIILVGSENGIKDSEHISSKFISRSDFIDTVGKLTLAETASVISNCDLIVGVDGGLLHIASALRVKIVALFVGGVEPEFYFTKATRCWNISGYNDPNEIKPISIAHKILEVYKIRVKNENYRN